MINQVDLWAVVIERLHVPGTRKSPCTLIRATEVLSLIVFSVAPTMKSVAATHVGDGRRAAAN